MTLRARSVPVALALVLLAGIPGLAAPDPAAASAPRVAIIVGPTDITDSHYLPSAESIRATAIAAGATVDLRYCATPAEAKDAANGADVIVYLGHGNGYPNPYSQTLLPDRTNGWGLRDPQSEWVKGEDPCDDEVLRYYGQDYLTGRLSGHGWTEGPITPAPNFVMVYSNACYAPGAGEERPAPAQSVAVSRVAHYSDPILELGGTYFATDLGSRQLVDLILRNPSMAFADIFRAAPGYSASALRSFDHPLSAGDSVWVQKTTSQWLGEDYWFAFAGDPYRSPSGASVLYGGLFKDIWGSTFRDDIVWLAETGITTGCGPEVFCPKGAVTRAQMAAFLVRALNLPPSSGGFFHDIGGVTGASAINSLAAAGIASGCADGLFCPYDLVSRAEMASFVSRALNLAPTDIDWFTDDDGLTHEININRFAQAGITTGCAHTLYCPANAVTREQMAAFLSRALK